MVFPSVAFEEPPTELNLILGKLLSLHRPTGSCCCCPVVTNYNYLRYSLRYVHDVRTQFRYNFKAVENGGGAGRLHNWSLQLNQKPLV